MVASRFFSRCSRGRGQRSVNNWHREEDGCKKGRESCTYEEEKEGARGLSRGGVLYRRCSTERGEKVWTTSSRKRTDAGLDECERAGQGRRRAKEDGQGRGCEGGRLAKLYVRAKRMIKV